MYKFFQKAYSSPIGKWADVHPEYIDLVSMLLPGINSILAITFMFDSPYTDKWEKEYSAFKIDKKRKFLCKIFKIQY